MTFKILIAGINTIPNGDHSLCCQLLSKVIQDAIAHFKFNVDKKSTEIITAAWYPISGVAVSYSRDNNLKFTNNALENVFTITPIENYKRNYKLVQNCDLIVFN